MWCWRRAPYFLDESIPLPLHKPTYLGTLTTLNSAGTSIVVMDDGFTADPDSTRAPEMSPSPYTTTSDFLVLFGVIKAPLPRPMECFIIAVLIHIVGDYKI